MRVNSTAVFVSACLQKHVYHARPALSVCFYIHLQLCLPNAIPLHSLLVPWKLKRQPRELRSCICTHPSPQTLLPQGAPLPWVTSHLSPREAFRMAPSFGSPPRVLLSVA